MASSVNDLKPVEMPTQRYEPPPNSAPVDNNGEYINPWDSAQNAAPDTSNTVAKGLINVDKMRSEGVEAGSQAASALFNQNRSAISKALSQRANQSFALNKERNRFNTELSSVQRQQMRLAQLQNQVGEMEKLRKINEMGKLKWADQMANYNYAIESAKIGAINEIWGTVAKGVVGGGGGMAGGMGGGMMGGGGGGQMGVAGQGSGVNKDRTPASDIYQSGSIYYGR